MKNHYFTTEVIKMGVWSLMPGDCETWHSQNTNRCFQKHFGIPKESFMIYEAATNLQHAYVSKRYLKLLYDRIDEINGKNFLALSKKLKAFYPMLAHAQKVVSKNRKTPAKLSNAGLAAEFFKIRNEVQRITIFDQFTWYAEEYWTPKMQNVLVKKLGLVQGSQEYNRVLFGLTKPEKISTTLRESREVLSQALAVKGKKKTLTQAASVLAKKFGWLPVFCFGTAWGSAHYEAEIKNLLKTDQRKLQKEYELLKNYTKIRNRGMAELVKKYRLSKQDLQIFIDFGLAIDTRNEAEYFVSYSGFFLMPLYEEMAKRLYLTTTQIRVLTQQELLDCVRGKINPQKILASRRHWGGWGCTPDFKKRVNFSEAESKKLFTHIESYVKPVQGGDDSKGLCASPGKAVGSIRIVPSPDQNDKVQKGDIMVTYATTTDYLPAMKRAGAIITEVGGLTCHAAVVSREFGIPCVVALSNAMKNFTDGQMVEVDANSGTVTEVKK